MHIFKDQVAVITGGASGIGKAFAYQFGTEGMKVVIADVEENSLNNTVSELQSHDIEVIGIITDVSNQKDVANLYKKTIDHFGKVHILCNNAGVAGDLDFVGQRNKPLWEHSSSLWDWTFGVNVPGVLNGIKELGLNESTLNKIIKSGYNLLNLINYFTCGPKETRSWTIDKNTLAPQAAGKIHTDFEKGFIRAETISYNDFVAFKGEALSREAGKLRQEGKDYIVKDGDILHFLFNV